MDYSIYDATFHTGPARRASKRARQAAVKSFSRCALSLVLFSLIASAVIYAVEIAIVLIYGAGTANEIFTSNYFMWAMQVLGPYIIAFPILLLITKGLPRARYKSSKLAAGEFLTVFLISCGVMVFGSVISNLISAAIEIAFGVPVVDVTSDIILSTPLWIILAVVVVIGPIVEEIIFRKVFIDRMSIYGDRLAIVVSSVLFGLFHGNISQLIYATALGCVLGYVYTKTRKIKYTVALHILLNFFGTVPSIIMLRCADTMDKISAKYPDGVIPDNAFSDSVEIIKASVTVISLSAVQYALAAIGIILLIVLTAKRAYTVPDNCEIRLRKRTVFRAAFFNFGMIVFIIFSALTILLSINPDIMLELIGAEAVS